LSGAQSRPVFDFYCKNKTAYFGVGGMKETPCLLHFSPNTVPGGLVPMTSDVPNAFHPAQEVKDVINVRLWQLNDCYHGMATRPGRHGQGHDFQSLAAKHVHEPASYDRVLLGFKRNQPLHGVPL
jgi:hypothetical protein